MLRAWAFNGLFCGASRATTTKTRQDLINAFKVVFKVSHHSGIKENNNWCLTLSGTRSQIITSAIGTYKLIFLVKCQVLRNNITTGKASYIEILWSE